MASTESLLTVDLQNTVAKQAPIQLSATVAMKWNRTKFRHSMDNFKFQSFSIARLKKLVFYVHIWPNDARVRHQQKAY